MEKIEGIMTISEVSDYLDISETTVRRWANSGMLKCFKMGKNKHRRFYKNEVDSFKEKQLPNVDDDNLISLEEAIKIFNVSKSTLRRKVYSGEIVPVKAKYRQKLFFDKNDLLSKLKKTGGNND